jgi:hypothetical protein
MSDVASTSPPIVPGSAREAARPKVWPTVIGVIAIVFGVLGALGGCGGLVILPLVGWMSAQFPPEAAGSFAGMLEWRGALLVMYAAMLALGVLLAVGGVRLSRRRPGGVKIIRWWAWLKILFALGSAPITILMQVEQFETMEETTGETMPFDDTTMIVILVGGAIVGAIWYCLLPAFMLIWFSALKIRNDVAQWTADESESTLHAGA